MTHLSLFSGIGGFDLGFELAGIESVAQVENNAFCLEVLRTHWPEVPKYEDIRDFNGSECRGVNVISGGFPCQGLSVAGRREGLADPRSGLFFEMCRVVGEARPEFVVWENVPGLLSSNGGEDFATVLGTLADIGYHGAWRIMDSQFFGVAQRRRRVFGVFARGDAGWRSAAAVLLEPEGGGWNPEEGGEAGEATATGTPASTLNSGGNDGGFRTEPGEHLVPERSYALREDPGGIGQGHNTTYAIEDVGRKQSGGEEVGVGVREGPMYTLQGQGQHGVSVVNFDTTPKISADKAMSLRPDGQGRGRAGGAQAVVASAPPDPPGVREAPGLPRGMDSARYRALGNAVTVNAAYWIGLRIMAGRTA